MFRFILIAGSVFALGTGGASAQTVNEFVGDPGVQADWMSPGSWSQGAPPTLDNFAVAIDENRHALFAGGNALIHGLRLGATPGSQGFLTQTGGQLAVLGSVNLSSTNGGPSIYVLENGVLLAVDMQIRDGARFAQSGGVVTLDSLRVHDHDPAEENRYLLSGGALFVGSNLFAADFDSGATGVIDFAGGISTLSVGQQSWVTFDSQSIANAQNATLHVGAGSLVQVEAGMDLVSIFGAVELNNSVVHEFGTPIQVAADQQLYLGTGNAGTSLEHGLVVHGYVGERLYSGPDFFGDGFQVHTGGHLDVGRAGTFFVTGGNAGVFGGVAEVRDLEFRGANDFFPAFVVDSGVLNVNGWVRSSSSEVAELTVNGGVFRAERIRVDNRLSFRQFGGTTEVEGMSINSGPPTGIFGGFLSADYIDITNILEQEDARVEVGYLGMDSAALYRFTGVSPTAGSGRGVATPELADLLVTERFVPRAITSGAGSVVDFAGQTRTIYAEGAFLDFSSNGVQPFRNAENATLVLDEHSMLLIDPSIDLHTVFGTFVADGFIALTGQPFVIPSGRVIHGSGELPEGSHIYGTLVADTLYDANLLTVHPGAYIDMGEGLLTSWDDEEVDAEVLGGTLRAYFHRVFDFTQSGGETYFNYIDGDDYRLHGGTSTVLDDMDIWNLDFGGGDGQLVVGPGAHAIVFEIAGGQNASVHVGANALFQIHDFDAVPEQLIGTITGPGLVLVRGQDLILPEGFHLQGDMEVYGSIENRGMISPGNSRGRYQDGIGRIHIDGDFVQTEDGVLRIEFAYDEESVDAADYVIDELSVGGTAELGGYLDLVFVDGFIPQPDQEYAIILDLVSGQFINTTVDGRIETPWGSFAIDYLNFPDLEVTLYDFRLGVMGDLDGDGVVGVTDLDLVLGNWGDPVRRGDVASGDWTGDGVVDGDDLQVVLDNWGDGQPPAGPFVPEPGTLGLFVLAMLGCGRARGRRC